MINMLNLLLVLHIDMSVLFDLSYCLHVCLCLQSLHPSDISSILTVMPCLERADHLWVKTVEQMIRRHWQCPAHAPRGLRLVCPVLLLKAGTIYKQRIMICLLFYIIDLFYTIHRIHCEWRILTTESAKRNIAFSTCYQAKHHGQEFLSTYLSCQAPNGTAPFRGCYWYQARDGWWPHLWGPSRNKCQPQSNAWHIQ